MLIIPLFGHGVTTTIKTLTKKPHYLIKIKLQRSNEPHSPKQGSKEYGMLSQTLFLHLKVHGAHGEFLFHTVYKEVV